MTTQGIYILANLWHYLDEYPQLSSRLRPRRGLEWKYDQSKARSDEPREGFRKGFLNAREVSQFAATRPGFLDYREKYVRRGYDQNWNEPKLIINATRLSRGPWRVGAIADFEGLLYSEQFLGLRPIKSMDQREITALAAVMNGPIANAFIATRSPDRRFRVSAVKRIPIPHLLPSDIAELVFEYRTKVAKPRLFGEEELVALLHQIDAAVLKAYDLPPRLERELLELFRNSSRPVVHPWRHWLPDRFEPFIPLHEFVSKEYQKATQPWIQEIFKPLPEEEAEALRGIEE